MTSTSPLTRIFEYYGFDYTQHADLIELLYLAGEFAPEKMKADSLSVGFTINEIAPVLSAVRTATSSLPDGKKDFPQILNALNQLDSSSGWPKRIHNWLITVTQRDFFARKKGEERWEQETGKWMVDNKDALTQVIEKLGLTKEVAPPEGEYGGVAIFGSTKPEMEKRLQFARRLIDQSLVRTEHLFLLGGERVADAKVDGGTEYLQALLGKLNAKLASEGKPIKASLSDISEMDLMRDTDESVRNESIQQGSPTFEQLPRMPIYAAKKPGAKRATTIDTLEALRQAISEKEELAHCQKILFISRAPNIHAQAEDVGSIFKNEGGNFIVVGESITGCPDNRSMGAFGARLFGGYIRVAQKFDPTLSEADLRKDRAQLSFDEQQKKLKKTILEQQGQADKTQAGLTEKFGYNAGKEAAQQKSGEQSAAAGTDEKTTTGIPQNTH